jgi:hypothetical protein
MDLDPALGERIDFWIRIAIIPVALLIASRGRVVFVLQTFLCVTCGVALVWFAIGLFRVANGAEWLGKRSLAVSKRLIRHSAIVARKIPAP